MYNLILFIPPKMNDKYIFSCSQQDDKVFHKLVQTINVSENKENLDANILIHDIYYHPSLLSEEIYIISRHIQSNWFHIQSIALNDEIIPYEEIIVLRETINQYMNLIRLSLIICDNTNHNERYLDEVFKIANHLSKIIVPYDELEPDVVIKLSAVKANNNKSPIYQYLHANLEMQYNLLTLFYFCGKSSTLDKYIAEVAKNLIVVSEKHFERVGNGVFVCSCMKHFFEILKFIKHKMYSDNPFWKMFNDIVQENGPLFSITLLKELAITERIEHNKNDSNSNFELLEIKIKTFLINAETNSLLKLFKLIDPLLNQTWVDHSRIEVFQLIWDYYSKRLNVSNKNYSKLCSMDLYKNLEYILNKGDNYKEDVEMFVSLLLLHLKKHPEHWGKMKGRIYSQLGTNKLKELNETGIGHVGLLFIGLSTIFFEEMEKRMLSFIDMFLKDKKDLPIIWNISMVFIYQNVKDGRDLEKTALKMNEMLNNASLESRSFYFINCFIMDFKHCLTLNQDMTLHQWMIFGVWLDKYITTCSIQDLRTILQLFILILEILMKTDAWLFWKPIFKDMIYPSVKKISYAFNSPEEIGKIVGLISIMDLELSESIFLVFTSDVSPKVSKQFLLTTLDNHYNKCILSEQQKSLFIQCWIKISLLLGESKEQLTDKIIEYDLFAPPLKSYLAKAVNPLYALLEYLGSDIKSHLQSTEVHKICENTFGHIDRWLTQYLNQIDDEVIVHQIFTFIALGFFHCGRLLYNRNKISTPLTKLVEVVLLPQEVLFGKCPNPTILNALKQTWHIFFEALVNLNDDCDKYLERTVRDMITKYVPFFSTTDSPFMKCLDKEKAATILFEKIALSYFRHPVKETDTNILKVLKFLKEILQSTTSLCVIKIILHQTLYSILEFIILHTQRNAALVVVKTLTNSPLYPEFKNEFCNIVLMISEKYLPHNTTSFFQLLCILAKFVPIDMRNMLGAIKQHVSKAERLRGVGFDKSLRMHYEKFENTVNENIGS